MTKKELVSAPVIYRCTTCHSSEVLRDAWTEWDVVKQTWGMHSLYEKAYCTVCDGETSLYGDLVSNGPHVLIVETQDENHPTGMPDEGCPEEALRDYLACWAEHEGEDYPVMKGEHEFIIWADRESVEDGERPTTFYANAFAFVDRATGKAADMTKQGVDPQFVAYYEYAVQP